MELEHDFSIAESRELKKKLGLRIVEGSLSLPTMANYIHCRIHRVPIRLCSRDPKFISELSEWIPNEWQGLGTFAGPLVRAHFSTPGELGVAEEVEWDDDSDHDCNVRLWQSHEIAVQRDFLGVRFPSGDYHMLGELGLDDAFFNALRWLLPREMLNYRQIVLHSSCVIGEDGRAHVFLGESGAGKTSIAGLAQGRKVLGDDMNVLHVSDNGVTIETAALGQSLPSTVKLGQCYPVAGFYWLKKGSAVGTKKLSPSQARLKMIASCRSLYWESLVKESLELVVPIVETALSRIPLYELEFTLDGKLWEHLDTK